MGGGKRMNYVDECKLLGIPIEEDVVHVEEEPEKPKRILDQVVKPKRKGK